MKRPHILKHINSTGSLRVHIIRTQSGVLGVESFKDLALHSSLVDHLQHTVHVNCPGTTQAASLLIHLFTFIHEELLPESALYPFHEYDVWVPTRLKSCDEPLNGFVPLVSRRKLFDEHQF